MTAYRLRLSLPEQIPPRLARTTFYWTAQGRSSFGSTYGPRLGGLGPAPQPNVDFVRIATAVFAADRTEARQFGGSNWNQRDIELTVPVSKVDRWEPLTDQLATLFGFLTGDQWHFRFVAARSARETVVSALPPPQRVVLLSGGADSAIGALLSRSQLQGTESHTLVSHVGLTSMAPIQRRVASQVEALMPGPGQRHIQVTFGRRQKQPNGTSFGRGEPSSRSRSALFLAFGLAVAGIDGVPLWIPENGFASLNPPLGPERRGSLSTRTRAPAKCEHWGRELGCCPRIGAHSRSGGSHCDVKDRFERSDGLVVRRCVPSEFAVLDDLLDEHHWLGRGLFGATVRQVAMIDGAWVALIGWGSPAFRVGARDRFIGWSREQQRRRLRHVVNNQRFCVLPDARVANLASAVLSRSLRRLSGDYAESWGYPALVAETFTDPSRHDGGCYRAANFQLLGETAGWGRSNGEYVYHGKVKSVCLTRHPHGTTLPPRAWDHLVPRRAGRP